MVGSVTRPIPETHSHQRMIYFRSANINKSKVESEKILMNEENKIKNFVNRFYQKSRKSELINN